MYPAIETLLKDINESLESDTDLSVPSEEAAATGVAVASEVQRALSGEVRVRKPKVLYASEIGKKCVRQIAYKYTDVKPEPLRGATRIKFLYGNILENMILQLVRAAGHTVEGEQKEYEHEYSNGWRIRGRGDCVIDGVPLDVKSASGFAFNKYKKEGITESNDGFGYRDQVGFYAGMEESEEAGLLMMNKENGNLQIVDVKVDFAKTLSKGWEKVKQLAKHEETGVLPPVLEDATVAEGKSGNRKLCTTCSYCDFKKHCFPQLRSFAYAGGKVTHLTSVAKLPKVPEIT